LNKPNKNIIKFFKKNKIALKQYQLNSKIIPTSIQGLIKLKCSFNNTLISLTDLSGKIKTGSSCGTVGFKGTKRSTKFAAQMTIEELSKKAKILNYCDLNVHLNGLGRARPIFIKSLKKVDLNIHFIKEDTTISHNGCRPKKIRRL
jgi:small subunit ribosomal protein S11